METWAVAPKPSFSEMTSSKLMLLISDTSELIESNEKNRSNKPQYIEATT